jgi:glutamine synthetase
VGVVAEGQAYRSPLPRSDGQPLSDLHRPADGRSGRDREPDRSGRPADKNLYDLPPEERGSIPEVCGSLKEALENLDKDRAFLKKGGVMDDDFIDSYIELKMEEVMRLQLHPHPVEFDMYYSC